MTPLREVTLIPDFKLPGSLTDRRVHLTPYDLSTIRVYTACPYCTVEFKGSAGFIGHMVVDHWCARDVALSFWRSLAA